MFCEQERSFSHCFPFGFETAALLCSVSEAFVPAAPTNRVNVQVQSSLAEEVDSVGNNVAVKNLLTKVQNDGLLTKVAESGLLSKAQDAGLSLSKLEPLLTLASENPEILVLVEASGPELLPLLPTIVDLTPAALPILATAVSVPPPVIGAAGLGALGAAGLAVVAIPDDSVVSVAVQTLAVGLALPVAGASFAGAAILSKLTK